MNRQKYLTTIQQPSDISGTIEKRRQSAKKSNVTPTNDGVNDYIIQNVIIQGLHTQTLVVLNVDDVESTEDQNYESQV